MSSSLLPNVAVKNSRFESGCMTKTITVPTIISDLIFYRFILSTWTGRPGQTGQTKIRRRVPLNAASVPGLHCLLFLQQILAASTVSQMDYSNVRTNMVKVQGPVVQSVVSLTSSLRVISLTVLADSIHNILIFFTEKMWVAFKLQKLLTIFQQKISAYLRITGCKS